RASVAQARSTIDDLCPVGIEEGCDECGGDPGRCADVQPNCPYPRARRFLAQATADSVPESRPAVDIVLAEVECATRKFPTWPTDPLHALAVLGEEFGELTKAVLQLTYEPHKVSADDVRA